MDLRVDIGRFVPHVAVSFDEIVWLHDCLHHECLWLNIQLEPDYHHCLGLFFPTRCCVHSPSRSVG